jgi:membrane dipeptidase
MLSKNCLIPLLFLSQFSFAQSFQKLHQKSLVIDTHNDVMISILEGLKIENDLTGKTHSDIGRFKKGGVDVQIFSIWSDERYEMGKGFNYANRQIDSLYSIVLRNPDKMMMIKTPAELKQAVQQKKLGVMLGLEGGHMIEDNLQYLDSLFKRGVRYMTLTWNNSTSWASSAADEAHPNPPGGRALKDSAKQKGLTEFGRTIVKKMNELGMLVDLSHVGEQTFWDAMAIVTKPVIVSHSCVYNLCPHRRNLKDDQIKAVGKNGGVIHLNFYSGFLDSNYEKRKTIFFSHHAKELDSLKSLKWPSFDIDIWMSKKYPVEMQSLRPPLSVLLDHLDYIVKMIGVDHVGLGSDFDGIESAPQELDDVTDFPLITKGLIERGYSKKEIKKILGENFVRIFKASLIIK